MDAITDSEFIFKRYGIPRLVEGSDSESCQFNDSDKLWNPVLNLWHLMLDYDLRLALPTQQNFLYFNISFFLQCWNNWGGLHFTAQAWGSFAFFSVLAKKRTCSAKFAEKKIIEWFLLTTWEENSLFISANRARGLKYQKFLNLIYIAFIHS